MKEQCFEFRSCLSAALEAHSSDTHGDAGREAQAREMQSLGWHEHLLHCGECRQLLEGEQMLEELLGSLPQPELSTSQRTQLVLRLQENLKLERLLDVADPYAGAPQGLSARILQGVRSSTLSAVDSSEGERGLESQLIKLESVEAPVGLAARVMRYCQDQAPMHAHELIPQKPRASHSPGRGVPLLRHWLTTGLVAASLAAFLWYLPGKAKTDPQDPSKFVADTNSSLELGGDAEVLALLDTLDVMDLVDELDAEEWELVDQYDSYALFLMEDETTTDGDAR